MKRALIIGQTGGIGSAVAKALTGQGVAVTGLSRSTHRLDLMRPETIDPLMEPLEPEFDLIFVATGGLTGAGLPPEKSLRALTPEAMMAQFALNTVGPAMILRHAARLLPKDRRAVFAVLSARVGSIGDNALGGWYSYRAAKTALNQVVHTGAIELARSHRQAVCVALHPGTVATSFTEEYAVRHPTVPPLEAAQNLLRVIDDLTPSDTGQFFDWGGKKIVW